jgi:hypothetical protein
MRTTLTLDADVTAALKQLRKEQDCSFKELINDALRRGIRDLNERKVSEQPYRTRVVDLGPSKIGSLDKISEALAIAEGEDFK